MAGADNVVINVRERPLSSDINDLQALKDRTLLEALHRMFSDELFDSVSTGSSSSSRDLVLGGLVVTPNGASVNVSPGAIVQFSSGLAPTPGPLDSSYRIALNLAAKTITAPSPGSNTYYLLQAQMVDVVALSESRDVLDPSTGNFVPTTVDKRRERQISFSFKAGTATQIPAPDPDFVPIAAIFRPGGGGNVNQTDIFDCRPLWSPSHRGARSPHITRAVASFNSTSLHTIGTNDSPINLDVEAFVKGQRLFAGLGTSGLATILNESGLTFPRAGVEIIYLYICAPNGLPISGVNGLKVVGRGVLVYSTVAPDLTRRNSASITLPSPFSGVVVPAGEAVLVGAVQTDSSGDIVSQDIFNGETLFFPRYVGTLTPGSPVDFDGTANTTTRLPASALYGLFYTSCVTSAGTPGTVLIDAEPGEFGITDRSTARFQCRSESGSNSGIVKVPLNQQRKIRFKDTQVQAGAAIDIFHVGWGY